MNVSVIIACAGKGERAGLNQNKLLFSYNGKPVFMHTLDAFISSGLINNYIIVASNNDYEQIKNAVPSFVKVVLGGATRTESVKNALALTDSDIVLIHDGARPFVSKDIISRCIESAINFGSGITAIPTSDTLCKSEDDEIVDYVGKSGYYQIQTPQAFNALQIKKADSLAGNNSFNDDGEVYKNYIGKTRIVLGEKNNIKLTFKEDFNNLLKTQVKVGVGYDCHKLVENRKLILGGIEIPHDKGLLGHSDADVLTHAIMDALLSSCSLRDIGYHFPDTDEKFKGASSIELLKEVLVLLKEQGYKPFNVSATILAQKPKLLGFIPQITEKLASVLDVPKENVGIGATTLEGLGFVGREEGICVHATCTVIPF